MSEEIEPIKPGEPLVPGYEPIEIHPGQTRPGKPLELKPNSPPRKFEDDAPEIPEPELKLGSGGGIRRPTVFTKNGYEWPEWRDSGSNWTFPLPPVDEVSKYESFRNRPLLSPAGDYPWGIWISSEGHEKYAWALKVSDPKWEWRECCKAAWNFISTHQTNHFLTDRAVATLESVELLSSRRQQQFWNIFRQSHQNMYSTLEESSACAYSLRNVGSSHSQHFQVLLGLQPLGYQRCSSDGKHICSIEKLSHQQGVSHLLSLFLDPQTPYRAMGLHGLMLYKDHKKGTKGDLYFTINGKKDRLKIYDAY